MKFSVDLAGLFVRTFRFEKSPKTASALLVLWGLLHLFVGMSYFLLVTLWNIEPSIALFITFIACVAGIILIKDGLQLYFCNKH